MNNSGVCPENCLSPELVKGQPVNPMAWEQQPSLACITVMRCMKRRQEGVRGVRVNPETYIVEGAESYTWTRRQHLLLRLPNRQGLPGAKAHIEAPGEQAEQERPIGNHGLVGVGAGRRGKTGASWR